MAYYCDYCGHYDDHYDENAVTIHSASPKHICNKILYEFKHHKKSYTKNRHGIFIFCSAEAQAFNGFQPVKIEKTDHQKCRISVKPNQKVKFSFHISNDCVKDDLLIVGIQLGHPQPQFVMNNHPYVFGENPHPWAGKTTIHEEVTVSFQVSDIGEYQMPIMLTFHRKTDKKNIIFVREMVVMVEENPSVHLMVKSPYTNEDLKRADHLIPSLAESSTQQYKIPKLLKILLPRGLEESSLDDIRTPELREQLRQVLITTRAILQEGITKENYMLYFHHLLWWEEVIARINLRKYNMKGVTIEKRENTYLLEVPGLAEKRPSLIRGDRVFLQPQDNLEVMFECVVKQIQDSHIQLSELDSRFDSHYTPTALFDVRFIMSRVPLERGHTSVSGVFVARQECRLFPVKPRKAVPLQPISKFYNELVAQNEEQRSAVEHIVSGTSGLAPYIVFGPPGTGKTMTIVEAIIQIVAKNSSNRVLVCTDSNMAADHIAVKLLEYKGKLRINNFLVRANSQSREWTVLPAELALFSNGSSYESFQPLNNDYMSTFRVVVTTLLHAAKYASARSQSRCKLQVTHLFVDEAAQASEPNTLVPVTGLLAPSGRLVLAGDPQQLGPVCISREASNRGLGISLMERLRSTYSDLFSNDRNFITMLVKNFRSDPDILAIPNELFYKNELQPLAEPDPLSRCSILGLAGGARAVVFHALNSREQRMGKAPSYFNEKELEMLKRYVLTLVGRHDVLPQDIGIIAPYIRQVYKMKAWLTEQKFDKIEVGTVEAFQGKEKRVILVSTVRANCRLLEHDAKYGLGFLVDDKRFNVALTRAKAKLVIIGNPVCLTRDTKWRKYMDLCKELGTYHGLECEQLPRTSELLRNIAQLRFDRCGLTDSMKFKEKELLQNGKKQKAP